jgi:ketosteroid isomerase-like protein
MLSSLIFLAAVAASPTAQATDQQIVADLDTAYQLAVRKNDAETMDRILHPSFKLVLGDGRVADKDHLLKLAREGTFQFEIQDEEPGTQSVIVEGDTAVVTAKLRLKGTREGQPFERLLWFSDTYVRTPGGWRYLFGQASLPLPQQ